MKKVLIVAYSLEVGGVERALIGMLNQFDFNNTMVTLRLARLQGQLLENLPNQVVVEEIIEIRNNWNLVTKPLLKQIWDGLKKLKNVNKYLLLLSIYLSYKIQGHYHNLFNLIFENSEQVQGESFDMAISYSGPSSILDYYVAKIVNAKQKIAWIHYDIDKFNVNFKSEQLLYPYYNRIFIVSEAGKLKFDSKFPEFSVKSDVFHNIIDEVSIKKMAESPMPKLFKNSIIITTVGRVALEKGQDRAIKALAILRERGYNVNWILVGGGNFEKEVIGLANDLKVADFVHMTGVCPNPYPYLKDCDIYVQPSVHEGFCITVAEAKLFGMPIVATDFTGAREQLKSYPNGFVVGHSPQSIADAITSIINTKSYLEKHKLKSSQSDFQKLNQMLYQ